MYDFEQKEEKQRIQEQKRREINSHPLTDYYPLEKSKGANCYCCPICGSGTGRHRTGALYIYPDTYQVVCFANNCFGNEKYRSTDTLGALRLLHGCSEIEAFELADVNDLSVLSTPKMQPKKEKAKPKENYSDFILSAFKQNTFSYLESRGISKKTQQLFHVGFCAKWKHPKLTKTNVPYSPRCIIPNDSQGYLARDVRQNLTENQTRYCKQKAGISDTTGFFMVKTHDVVGITEGEIDAMSLVELGLPSCSLGSVALADRFMGKIKEHIVSKKTFILFLDNDDAGQKTTDKLKIALKAQGHNVYLAHYPGKDPNSCLIANRQAMKQYIEKIYKEIKSAEK